MVYLYSILWGCKSIFQSIFSVTISNNLLSTGIFTILIQLFLTSSLARKLLLPYQANNPSIIDIINHTYQICISSNYYFYSSLFIQILSALWLCLHFTRNHLQYLFLLLSIYGIKISKLSVKQIFYLRLTSSFNFINILLSFNHRVICSSKSVDKTLKKINYLLLG